MILLNNNKKYFYDLPCMFYWCPAEFEKYPTQINYCLDMNLINILLKSLIGIEKKI